ncbi:MAG: flagellar filament capping protein FliD [Pseudomonadales bacterium]|nr:flagellar filament capping protein FliD [Pseudomonadales bacterium]
MASIQSLGIGSGLLTSELVDDIIAAERESTDLRINAKKAEYEARISSYGAIKSQLDSLRSTADALSNSNTLLSNLVTSSNEGAAGATATAQATPGVHSVEVLSLARAHTLASSRFDDIQDPVGEGTLSFRFGTTTFSGTDYDSFTVNPSRLGGSVVIDSSNNSLSGVRDAINQAGIGVVASIVNDGEGYVLVLTSSQSGENNSMEITATESGTPGLSALAFNAGASTAGTNLTQTVAADDARMRIDGIVVRRKTNEFTDVVPGVTFTARGLNAGAPATIAIVQDTASISERMQSFVDAFNAMKSVADELTAFDEERGSGALLIGDSLLRSVRSQMRRMLNASVPGLQSTTLRALVDLGVSTDQNADFKLKLDSAKLESVLRSMPRDAAAMLADQRQSSDDLVRFVNYQPRTQAGTYDVEVTRLATRGRLDGATTAALAGPVVIDASNDELTLRIDGVSTGTISIPQGSYADGAAVAQVLNNLINDVPALTTARASVSVTYNDTLQRLEVVSTSYGSRSRVALLGAEAGVTTTLGLAAGDGITGVDTAGRINGIEGIGSGQFLSLPSGPPPATAGRYVAAPIAGFATPPLTIDATNGTFSVAVDGVSSGSIVLAEGDYASGEALATQMQSAINEDPALAAGNRSVTVQFDSATGRFAIASASRGNASTVNLLSATPETVSALGLEVRQGEPGRPAGRSADPAGGIQIQVQGTTLGSRGTVTLVRGVMNQFDRYLDSVLNFGGSLDAKLSTLDDQIAELDKESKDFDKRMNLLEDRMRIQFAAADALISELNSTSSFLEQQLSTLPGYTRKDR